MIDPITEADLSAYVDDELDALRRVEVEAHLARHPEDAARVMADLRDRDALRESLGSLSGAAPERLRLDARRVDRAMAWDRFGMRLRRAAAIALLVGAGWLAHSELGTFGVPGSIASPVDPALVVEARLAHEAAMIRARTAPHSVSRTYARADLESATGLKLPAIPESWSIRDVQIFPAREGAGVEVEIDAGKLGAFALYAMGSANAAALPEATQSPDGKSLYWQKGSTAFALSGAGKPDELREAGAQLMASLK